MARIGGLYALNKARLALACKPDAPRQLPAPFVELDPERMPTPAYLEACANHGSKAPADITPWLPWNFVPPETPVARDLAQGDQPRGPAP